MSNIIRPQYEKQSSERQSSSDSPTAWLGVLSGATLAIGTAMLFATGHANRAGYLYQFGLEPSQVPADLHDTLNWGYVMGVPSLIGWLIVIVLVCSTGALILWTGGKVWARGVRHWPALRKLSDSTPRQEKPSAPFRLLGVSVIATGILYFVFLSYWILTGAYTMGVERGHKLLAELETDPRRAATERALQYIEIAVDGDHPRVEQGYRLMCTTQLCSIYDVTPASRGVRLISLADMQHIRVIPVR